MQFIPRLQRFPLRVMPYLGRWPRLLPFAPLALVLRFVDEEQTAFVLHETACLTDAAISPGIDSGSVTRRNVQNDDAPRSRDASISRSSSRSRAAYKGRMKNGM